MITPTYKLLLVPLPAPGLRLHRLCWAILPHLSDEKKKINKKACLEKSMKFPLTKGKTDGTHQQHFFIAKLNLTAVSSLSSRLKAKLLLIKGVPAAKGAHGAWHLRPWTQFNFCPMSKCLLHTPTLGATFTAVCNISTRDSKHGLWRGEFISLGRVLNHNVVKTTLSKPQVLHYGRHHLSSTRGDHI